MTVRTIAQSALLAYLHYVEGETRRLFSGPIMEWHQPIVAIDGKGDAHSRLLAVFENAFIADYLYRDLLRVGLIWVGTTYSCWSN